MTAERKVNSRKVCNRKPLLICGRPSIGKSAFQRPVSNHKEENNTHIRQTREESEVESKGVSATDEDGFDDEF